eukprot:gene13217-9063_t
MRKFFLEFYGHGEEVGERLLVCILLLIEQGTKREWRGMCIFMKHPEEPSLIGLLQSSVAAWVGSVKREVPPAI